MRFWIWVFFAILMPVCGGWAEETPHSESLDILLERGARPVLEGVEGYAPPPEAAVQDTISLDVERCVALALEQNAQALIAEEDLALREAQSGQAKSARLPQISTQAGYTYIQKLDQDISKSFLTNLLVDTQSLESEKGTWATRINVEQVLYSGGQIQAAIRASRHLAQSESWKREAILAQIAYETRQAYYDCLLSRALVRVAEESVETFEHHKADAEETLEVGLISRFEVLRAETELGARQSDLESAKAAANIALLNLKRILALPQSQTIALIGDLHWTPLEESVDGLIDRALAERAELRALEEGIAAGREQVKIQRGQFKPRAAAKAEYRNVDGGGSFMPDGWTFSVGAELDIYTGGRRKYEIKEAQAQLRNLQHQHDDVARLVELDVRQAFIRVQEAIAKIRKEKGTVALAEEGFRLSTLRFQEGVGAQVETLDAELALTNAKTQLVNALRDYCVAKAALQKALGKIYPAAPAPESTENSKP